MKSAFVTTAVLGTALFSLPSLAASIGHGHAHRHSHTLLAREPEPEPEPEADANAEPEPAGFVSGSVQMLSVASENLLNDMGMLIGKNLAASTSPDAPITLGGKGDVVLRVNNMSGQDRVVVCWQGPSWVNANQPAVTRTLPANKTMHVSFNLASGSVSGACSSVSTRTVLKDGQVFNTWLEFTVANSSFSTIDVSRLPNMNGDTIEAYTYPTKTDHNDGTGAACTTNMDTCVYKCNDDKATSCMTDYTLVNCQAGQIGNTASLDAQNGGCSDINPDHGMVVANLR